MKKEEVKKVFIGETMMITSSNFERSSLVIMRIKIRFQSSITNFSRYIIVITCAGASQVQLQCSVYIQTKRTCTSPPEGGVNKDMQLKEAFFTHFSSPIIMHITYYLIFLYAVCTTKQAARRNPVAMSRPKRLDLVRHANDECSGFLAFNAVRSHIEST